VTLDEISRPIKGARYVDVALNETSVNHIDSQIDTVLRYIHDVKIQERSVCFTDVSAVTCADGIYSHVPECNFKV
jgi:hypothetical protein